jgi:predicted DNA-binding ribbon-helix-helix protein
MLKKRSFSLAGHRTSVALEAEFWAVLEDAAKSDGIALARLVAQIDATRHVPLASALRVFSLRVASSGQDVVRSMLSRDTQDPLGAI